MVLGEDGNLYLSYFTGDTNEFYRLTFNAETEEYEAALLGDVGSGVWPAALYSVKSNAESSNSLPATGTMKMDAVSVSQEELAAAAQSVEMTLASVSNADNTQKDQQVEAEDAPAGGSLNAVQVSAEPVATVNKMPMELMGVGSDTDCTEKSVTLTITADNATTNGLITVDFDTDVLSFSDSEGMADFNSFAVADGKITFAYASKDAIAAGSTLATLTFTAEEEAEVDFKVTVVEDGDQKPGTEQTVTVQVPEHNYIATVVEPTCTEQGYTLYTCSNCGASYQDNYTDPTGHDWGEWTIEVAPTCVNEGTEIRTCANCGEEESRTVAATGHSFEDTVVEPTCTEKGYTVHTCSVCGFSYSDTEVDALGHSWGEWTVVKDANCNAPGEQVRTCSVCGETQSEVILPSGHTYETTVIAPTCASSGYTKHTCLLCGVTYATDVIDPLGHNWGEWVLTEEGDCFHKGVETRTCAACNETETRETELNPANCPSKAFTDLDTAAWYHESVDFVLSTGLMNGVGNEKFAPNNQMTRAMVVTVLYRLAGEPKVEGTVDFTDVPAGEYYYDALVWATENGLAMGVTETTFAPGRSITREQLVTFLYRYAQYAGLDVSGRADLTTFTDSQSVSSYAVDAFAWAVNAGIIDGVGNNTLAPRSTATRVQVAAVLMRLSRLS